MNGLQNFNFEGNGVRTVQKNSITWFAAIDVTDVLEIKNTTQAIRKLDDDERAMFNIGRQGDTNFISEPGLYKLISSSRKPAAKRFNRWVTHEVLPSVRQHGAYMTAEVTERAVSDPDFLIKLATQIKQERQRRIEAEQRVEQMKPKVLFADAVSTSQTAILVGDLAKLLRGNGVDIGANRLFAWMRERGYLIGGNRTDKNMPTQRAMNLGLFKIKETVITHSDGHTSVSKTPKVTGKGQTYFIGKFLQ